MQEPHTMKATKKPLGIIFIAIASLIAGIGMLLLLPNLLSTSSEIDPSLQTPLLASLCIKTFIFFVSAIGLLKQKRWGWWILAGYMMFEMIHYLALYLQLPSIGLQLNTTSTDLQQFQAKAIGRTITHMLVIVYLFKKNVLTYFKLQDKEKDELLFKLIGLGLGAYLLARFL